MGTAQPVAVTAYEVEIARDLARRALLVAPVPIILGAVFAGVDGAVSAAIGLVLVVVRTSSWRHASSPGPPSARPARCMGVVLGGYRRAHGGARSAIVLALGELSFIDLPVLVLTIAVVHLVLLVWETRHVEPVARRARPQARSPG